MNEKDQVRNILILGWEHVTCKWPPEMTKNMEQYFEEFLYNVVPFLQSKDIERK